MTAKRAKQIAFEVLQLFRKEAEREGEDPVGFDDWLFSMLDLEIGEVEEIYKPYEKYGLSVYAGSCYEDEHSPKDFDVEYFCK